MGESKAPVHTKRDVLAQEAAKRILKDIRGQRESSHSRKVAEQGLEQKDYIREETSPTEQYDTRRSSGAKNRAVLEDPPAERKAKYGNESLSARQNLPIRATRPTKVDVLPQQTKSPLSRLEQTLGNLTLKNPDLGMRQPVDDPESGVIESHKHAMDPSYRRRSVNTLHGYGRRSISFYTPEARSRTCTPQSDLSAPSELVSEKTHLNAKEPLLQPANGKKAIGKGNSDGFSPLNREIHFPKSLRVEDGAIRGPDVPTWLSFDQTGAGSPASASAIFTNTIMRDLKDQSLRFPDIINMVDSGWEKLSSQGRQAFEQQASATVKAMQGTTSTIAAELDTRRVSKTATEEIVDRLMITFYKLFGNNLEDSSDYFTEDESCWESSQSGCTSMDLEPADANDGANHSRDQHSRSGHQTNFPPAGSVALPMRKHRRTSQEGQSDGEDDEGNGKRRKTSSPMPDGPCHSSRRLACPFTKRYPNSPPRSPSCFYKGFSHIHRVKEHLYRVHLQPRNRCLRCYQTFVNESQLRAHARSAERCDEMEEPPEDHGLDAEQERLLRCRRRQGKDASEKDKWKLVFLICFPDVDEADVPSHYFEPYEQRPRSAQAFQRFEQYQRERLPQIVRQEFTRLVGRAPQLAQLTETLESQLVEIIRVAQTTVFEEYRNNGSEPALSEDGSQSQQARSVPEAEVPSLEVNGSRADELWMHSATLDSSQYLEPTWPRPSESFLEAPSDTAWSNLSFEEILTIPSASISDQQVPAFNDSAYASDTYAQDAHPNTGYAVRSASRASYPNFIPDWQDQGPCFREEFGRDSFASRRARGH